MNYLDENGLAYFWTKIKQYVQDNAGSIDLDWDNITGKPSTFPPSKHTHTTNDITNFPEFATINGQRIDQGGNITIEGNGNVDLSNYIKYPLQLYFDEYESTADTLYLSYETGSGSTPITSVNFKTINGKSILGEGNITVGGESSGSSVQVNPILTYGTQIATITVDGSQYDLYAPSDSGPVTGGDTVSLSNRLTQGTRIVTMDISGIKYDLYAPTAGSPAPGGDTVTFDQVLSSGTHIGTISINGEDTRIYAPTPTQSIAGVQNVNISGEGNALVSAVYSGNVLSLTYGNIGPTEPGGSDGNNYTTNVKTATNASDTTVTQTTTITRSGLSNITDTTTIPAATLSAAGVMTAADKQRLENGPSWDGTNRQILRGDGSLTAELPIFVYQYLFASTQYWTTLHDSGFVQSLGGSAESTGYQLNVGGQKWIGGSESSLGTQQSTTISTHTIPLATTTQCGVMSAADKRNLNYLWSTIGQELEYDNIGIKLNLSGTQLSATLYNFDNDTEIGNPGNRVTLPSAGGPITGDYLPLTGGTVTGHTSFTQTLSVGTEAADQKLNVAGGVVCGTYNGSTDGLYVGGILTYNGDTQTYRLNADGSATFMGNVNGLAFYETSDATLKENISVIDNDVDKVKNVELKQFNFKKETVKKYGVIAQDLEEAGLDNLVSTNEEGIKSVDYISFLILKIQELENRIKALESERR